MICLASIIVSTSDIVSLVPLTLYHWYLWHCIIGTSDIVSLVPLTLYLWYLWHCIFGTSDIVSLVPLTLYLWYLWHCIFGTSDIVSLVPLTLYHWYLWHCIIGTSDIVSLVPLTLYHWYLWHCIIGTSDIVSLVPLTLYLWYLWHCIFGTSDIVDGGDLSIALVIIIIRINACRLHLRQPPPILVSYIPESLQPLKPHVCRVLGHPLVVGVCSGSNTSGYPACDFVNSRLIIKQEKSSGESEVTSPVVHRKMYGIHPWYSIGNNKWCLKCNRWPSNELFHTERDISVAVM